MLRWAFLWSAVCSFVLLTQYARSSILRVPAEYETIGDAFEVVQDDDTILVSLGTYTEELTAPPLRFWLIGDVEIDTGDFARPVIDPSTMDSARWRKCLTIPDGCQLTVERMKFVNRAPMYPRIGFNTGGIYVASDWPVSFRYCRFDSVYRAIVDLADSTTPMPRVRLTIEDCCFTHAPRIQVRAWECGYLIIRRSSFQGGHCVSQLVIGGDSSTVKDCVFTGDSIAGAVYLRSLGNGDVAVRGTTFGPIDTCTAPVLRIVSMTHADIEDNVLRQVGSRALALAGFHWIRGDPISIRHNLFVGNHSLAPDAFLGVGVSDEEELPPEYSAMVDSNSFIGCTSPSQPFYGKALTIWTPAAVRGNRFMSMLPLDEATIVASPVDYSASQLRSNQFQALDYGVRSETYEIDGFYNYWGDPSGPYNALHNPGGQGARVDDLVRFDPWSPDTNFLSVPGINTPLPEGWKVEMYPNPFNSSLVLRFRLPNQDRVRVDVFDILGRRIRHIPEQIYSPGEHTTPLPVSGLSSGMYVVQMKSTRGQFQRKAVLLK